MVLESLSALNTTHQVTRCDICCTALTACRFRTLEGYSTFRQDCSFGHQWFWVIFTVTFHDSTGCQDFQFINPAITWLKP